MRLAVDATPLLGRPSGIGRYTRSLLEALALLPGAPEPVLTLFSLRAQVPDPPDRTSPAPRRLPARLLHPAWSRTPWPPVEWLTGPVDVFHATNFVLPPTRRAAGVVTVHDLSFVHHATTVDSAVTAYRRLVPRSLERADAVVTVTHAMKAEICAEYGVAPDSVTVAHLGVDPGWALASPPPAAGTPGGTRPEGLPERYVLFTGNLEPRKNLATLVRAHARARAQQPDVPPLVLVGPPGWGDVWGDAAPPGPPDVVQLGYLPEPVLRSVVAGASALVMPSVYEGFGLPVLEAMACRTPVLASDVAALAEVAGGHARLVPPMDEDAWAQALVDLPDPSPERLDAAREHALSFTWEATARTHLEVFRSAAARRGTHRMPG
ncbi:glycosyltransferase family 4 protein [Aquipuribacter hungaricus]|uniref:Glycosyltransferase family 4 protein n=1 Tax=Aquipuribacter hungaricus TaxID=545624 RepID=A0ABV7WKH7_9MICO